jgi:dihydrofolate reductase
MISMIVAYANNRVIGRYNKMLWHMPRDLVHFRQLTLNNTVIMGRNTFESLGSPLPDRRNIVLTRNRDYHPLGVEVTHSVEGVIELLEEDEEALVIGGGNVYRQFMALSQRLYITEISFDVEGDTFFPEIDETGEWKCTAVDLQFQDEDNPHICTFLTFERRSIHHAGFKKGEMDTIGCGIATGKSTIVN